MTTTVRTPPILNDEELRRLDAYWRAANYLSVGPDLPARQPAAARAAAGRARQAAPARPLRARRPGLNLLYAHLNRAIVARDLDAIYVTGPGHGGPGLVANAYLEGTYSEVYPTIGRDERRACARCSASSPSRAASPATSRPRRRARSTRAASSATRWPTRSARPSTTPTCWWPASSATARPRRARWPRAGTATSSSTRSHDGAVLPILHLNGYKIANPTVLARIPERGAAQRCSRGYGWEPLRGRRRRAARRPPGARRGARRALDRIAEIQRAARAARSRRAPALADAGAAHAEGLDRPEGRRRRARSRTRGARTRCRSWRRGRTPSTCGCSRRGCAATGPRSCSTRTGRLVAELAALPPDRRAPHEREPARQRRPAAPAARPAGLPRLRGAASSSRARPRARRPACSAASFATSSRENGTNFRLFGPDETASNRLGDVFAVTTRAWQGRGAPHGRGARPGRARHGGPLRAPLPGLAGGLPPDRPPRRVQLLRGVHPHRRLDVQPAREVAEGHAPPRVAAPDRVAQLPAELPRLAPGPQRLLAPGPGVHRPRREQEGRDRPRLLPAGRQHACCRWPTTACAAATT